MPLWSPCGPTAGRKSSVCVHPTVGPDIGVKCRARVWDSPKCGLSVGPQCPDCGLVVGWVWAQSGKCGLLQVDHLDMPSTLSELHSALMKVTNNKAQGPDAFPVEILKHFWVILAPLFSRMIREIKTKGKIPSCMNTALIRLLLKPDKDPR